MSHSDQPPVADTTGYSPLVSRFLGIVTATGADANGSSPADQARLAGERTALLAKLARTLDPPGATKAEMAAIEKRRQAVRDALPAGPAQTDIDAATLKLSDVEKLIAETRLTIAARQVTAGALAAATADLKAAVAVTSQDVRSFLEGKVAAFQADFAKATTPRDYRTIDVALAGFGALAKAAIAYGRREGFALAMKATCVAAGADDGVLTTALTEARDLAEVGSFPAAMAKLDAFEATPGAMDVMAFQQAIKAYRASPGGDRIGVIKGLDATYPGVKRFKDELATIIKAVKDGTRTAAAGTADIAALQADLGAFWPVYQAHEALRQAMAVLAGAARGALTTKLTEARAVWDAANPTPALRKLEEGLNLPVFPYAAAKKSIQAAYGSLVNPGGPGTALLEARFQAAEARAAGPPPDLAGGAAALLDLKPLMADIAAYRTGRLGFDLAAAGLDATVADAIRVGSDAKVAADDWRGAAGLIVTETAALGQAAAYAVRLAQAKLARGSADPMQQDSFDAVIERAEALATPDRKFAEAIATLDELRHMDATRGIDADASAYLDLRDATGKAVARARSALDGAGAPAAGKTRLAAAFKAACDQFDADRKLQDAIAALTIVQADAAAASAAASARLAADKLRAAIKATAAASWTTTEDDAFAAADTHIVTPDFAAAASAFAALRKSVAAVARSVANTLESADHGHSVAAHGPDSAKPPVGGGDDPQIIRVKTGMRADGKRSPSTTASSFESDADWLAARQAALDEINDYLSTSGITLTADDIGRAAAATPGAKPKRGKGLQIIIEHGRPIDRCVVGLRGDLRLDEGEVVEGDTASTYEIWTGLTRTRSNFEYFEDAPGSATGHWKLVQQFPHPDSWDNVRKVYTEPVPRIK